MTEEVIPEIKEFPIMWQVIIRATQNLANRAKDGADVRMLWADTGNAIGFVVETKKTDLHVIYDREKEMLEVAWRKFRVYDYYGIKKELIFFKTAKQIVKLDKAQELLKELYKKIVSNIVERSDPKEIVQDFYKLYQTLEVKQ